MTGMRKKFVKNIVSPDFQAGSINARMTSIIFVIKNSFVNTEVNYTVFIVMKTENARGAGLYVKKLEQNFFRSK